MKMSLKMSILLLGISSPLALLLACLGLATRQQNLFGWVLILLGVLFLAGGVIYFWLKRQPADPQSEEKGNLSFLLILPGFLAIFFAPPLEYLFLPQVLSRSSFMQWAGLGLVIVGIVLRIWVRRGMGDLYTGQVMVQGEHRLVTQGPYHFVRHPGYLGYLIIALGLGVGYSSLIGLAAIPVLLLPGLCYRISVEEKLLADAFGSDYQRYAGTTKRLIPGIW